MRPDLEAIKARAEAATAGPWETKKCNLYEDYDTVPPDGVWWIEHPGWIDCDDTGLFATKADAAFIAESRSDVPTLLAYIAELEAEANMWANR